MNILLNKLPTTLTIEGVEIAIDSDFRTSIMFEQMLKDKTLIGEELSIKAINLFYKCDGLISESNSSEAIEKLMWFYRCGKELKKANEETERIHDEICSYEHDADDIYSDFLDQYGIDLQEIDYLHWWKFSAMFNGLSKDSNMKNKISIRATDINKLPVEQREYYKKLKKAYEIPHNEDEEEIDELDLALMNGGDLTGMI